MKKTLIFQGAEAKVYLITPDSEVHKSDEVAREANADQNIIEQSSTILKERIPKTYRHKALDENIRKRRNKSEAKILSRCQDLNLNTPKLISNDKFTIQLEFIDGEKLSETLNDKPKEIQINIIKDIAKEVLTLHENNIIHGDLTTSNVILKNNKIYIIDFGLGKISDKIEDKAVDLHLIKEAINAKHYQMPEELWNAFKENYKNKEVLERLEIVEKRGRYKH